MTSFHNPASENVASNTHSTVDVWKQNFLVQIDKSTSKSNLLAEIIQNNESLIRQNKELRIKNKELADDLKAKTLAIVEGTTGTGAGISNDAVHIYKEEIKKLNVKLENVRLELTESYKSKGERTQKILDMSDTLQKYNMRIADLVKQVKQLESDNECMNKLIEEKNQTLQVLRDEVHALQLELMSTTEKYGNLKSDNEVLVKRLLEKVESEANVMNEANILYESLQMEKKKLDFLKTSEHLTLLPNNGNGYPSNESLPVGQVSPHTQTTNVAGSQATINKLETGGAPITRRIKGALPSSCISKIKAHKSEIYAISYSNNSGKYVTGGADKAVILWDSMVTQPNREISKFRSATQSIMTANFSPKDEFIVGGSNDESTYIWSAVTNRLRLTLTGHIGKVLAAKFNGDSSKVVTGSHDRTIKIWDLNKGLCQRTIFAFSSCNDLVLGDGANYGVISGHLDNHVRFWDTRYKTSGCANELGGIHTSQITGIDISPDRNVIVTNSKDNTLKLIDVRMFQVISTFSGEGYKNPCAWSRVTFCPTGKYFAVGGQDGRVYIWNTQTSKIEKILSNGHAAPVQSCSWSHITNQIVSCDKDKTVAIWDQAL